VRSNIHPGVAIAAIVIVLLGAGWYLWKKSDGAGNDAGAAAAQWAATEKWCKENNVDPRKDPMLAPIYYKYHPNEKPPEGTLPAPGGAAGMKAGAPTPGAPMMPPPPPGAAGGPAVASPPGTAGSR